MIVYVLTHHIPYDHDTLIDVFASFDLVMDYLYKLGWSMCDNDGDFWTFSKKDYYEEYWVEKKIVKE